MAASCDRALADAVGALREEEVGTNTLPPSLSEARQGVRYCSQQSTTYRQQHTDMGSQQSTTYRQQHTDMGSQQSTTYKQQHTDIGSQNDGGNKTSLPGRARSYPTWSASKQTGDNSWKRHSQCP